MIVEAEILAKAIREAGERVADNVFWGLLVLAIAVILSS